MAGKRVYITIPRRDYDLLRYIGVSTSECVGMLCRRAVLRALYAQLQIDQELQDYDAELARLEREEIVRGR